MLNVDDMKMITMSSIHSLQLHADQDKKCINLAASSAWAKLMHDVNPCNEVPALLPATTEQVRNWPSRANDAEGQQVLT